jgi:predicted HicB family RNase H-like nuclease
MKNNHFDGFSLHIFQDDDGDWGAHFVELPQVSAFGANIQEALDELAIAWKAYKDSCKKHKQPIPIAPQKKQYSGQFNVRIDKRIHKELAIEAMQVGLSLNALVAQKLAAAVLSVHAI